MERNFLSIFTQGAVTQADVNNLLKVNRITQQYGITVTKEDSLRLLEYKQGALLSNGRIELRAAESVADRLLEVFSQSPYVSQDNYLEITEELLEGFYYFKNRCEDAMGDDDLIDFMKDRFDKVCHGSVDLLLNRELENLVQKIEKGEFGQEDDYE